MVVCLSGRGRKIKRHVGGVILRVGLDVHLGQQVVDFCICLGCAIVEIAQVFLKLFFFGCGLSCGMGTGLLGRIACRNFAFFDQFCEIDDLFIGFSGVLGNHAPPRGLCAAAKGRNHAKYLVSYCKNDRFFYQFMAKDANLPK